MAERKDAIALYAEKEGIPYSEAVKNLTDLNKGFEELYVRGRFDLTKPNDRKAHDSMAAAFAANQELFAAFDSWRRAKYGDGMKDTILEASDTLGFYKPINSVWDTITGDDASGRLKKAAMEPYGFAETLDGNYIEPWRSEQAQDAAMEAVREATPPSDSQVEEERQKDLIDEMRAEQEAMQQGRQGQNVFLDRDPQIGAVRQQVRAAADNPFLFGTEGKQSQIEDLLDKAGRKIPAPDRSDARSVARFNNDFSSREFVRDAALRKQRELANLDRNHRNLVNSQGMQDTMMKWIVANPDHAMSEKGLANWTDQDKIAFAKNYKMGNFDDPAPAPKGVPMFDKDGLMGFQSEQTVKDRIGDKTFRVDPNKPNRAQMTERRNNQMLDEIRDEIKETGKHPFGEGPVLGTDYAREVALRDTFDGGDIGALKKSARDFRDGAVPGRNYTQSVGIPSPMPKNFEAPEDIFEPSQKMVSQDMLAKNNEEVNSVLDSVSLPGPRNPVKTLPFSLDNPTDNSYGEKAQRRANADKAYADWQARYGEGVRERKAFMDQRMQDREQEIKAKRQAAQAEAAPRPGQPASESRTVHDVFKEQELKRRQQASPFYSKNIFG